jgi:hypothetical protein
LRDELKNVESAEQFRLQAKVRFPRAVALDTVVKVTEHEPDDDVAVPETDK